MHFYLDNKWEKFNLINGQIGLTHVFTKNKHPHIVSIHINFHQNHFINECARKILAKTLYFCNFGV